MAVVGSIENGGSLQAALGELIYFATPRRGFVELGRRVVPQSQLRLEGQGSAAAAEVGTSLPPNPTTRPSASQIGKISRFLNHTPTQNNTKQHNTTQNNTKQHKTTQNNTTCQSIETTVVAHHEVMIWIKGVKRETAGSDPAAEWNRHSRHT